MRHLAALVTLVVSIISGCGKPSSKQAADEPPRGARHADADGAIKACTGAIAAAPGDETALIDRVVQGCKDLYVEAACREAWDRGLAGPPAERMMTVARGCRDAYCPLLPDPKPGLCAATTITADESGAVSGVQGWPELQLAILTLDLGRERAERLGAEMQKAVDAAMARTIEQVAVLPDRAPGGSDARCGAEIGVALAADGAWLGTRSGERRFAASCRGAQDVEAIANELRRLHSLDDSCASVSLSAASAVKYQEIIRAMDAAIRAGLTDVRLVDPRSLPVTFPDKPAGEDRLTAACSASTEPTPPVSGAAAAPASLPSGKNAALKKVPVLAITRTDILLDGRSSARVADVAAGKSDVIEALHAALKERSAQLDQEIASGKQDAGLRGQLVLQADRDTPAAVIHQIVQAADRAGFPTVLFAVSRTGG